MKKIEVNPGDRYARLEIIEEVEQVNHKRMFLCKCDCGVTKSISLSGLRHGKTQSCGCLQVERIVALDTSHGLSKTRLYRIWCHMNDRCLNPNDARYRRYGGRGIKICTEWRKFEQFYCWAIDNGYDESLTLDRKNNNGGYSPQNCKWSTAKEQSNNRSNNTLITFNGLVMTIAQWAEMLGINQSTLAMRIRVSGWCAEKALTTPRREGKRHNAS